MNWRDRIGIAIGLALLFSVVAYNGCTARKELKRQSVERGNLLDAAELIRLQERTSDLKAKVEALESQMQELSRADRVPCPGCFDALKWDVDLLKAKEAQDEQRSDP